MSCGIARIRRKTIGDYSKDMERENTPLEKAILDRIEAIGKLKQMIIDHWNERRASFLVDDKEMLNLSKHNDWYSSAHEEESEKLDACRRRMMCLEDFIDSLYSVFEEDL